MRNKLRTFLTIGWLSLCLSPAFAAYNPAAVLAQNPTLYGTYHGAADSTTAVQTMFNRLASNPPTIAVLDSPYNVSQVTIQAGSILNGYNFQLVENQPAGAASVVDVIGDFNILSDFALNAQRNINYQSCLHWYTYNLNIHYPGFNKFDGLYTQYCPIGVAIGALPSQYQHGTPGFNIPSQGTVTTPPNATDAPVSESSINRWLTYGTLNPLWMAQPNGKITIADSQLIANINEWTGEDHTKVIAVSLRAASTVNFTDDAIENQDPAGTGKLFDIWDNGYAFVENSNLESYAPNWLQDYGSLYLDKVQDFGFNGNFSPFQVDHNWSGNLTIRDSQPFRNRTVETSNQSPFLISTTGFGGSTATNSGGTVLFDGVQFLNAGVHQGTGDLYIPLCQNIWCNIKNSWKVVTNSDGTFASRYYWNDGPELFQGVIDQSACTISTTPSTTSPQGGWVFTGTGTASWNLDTSSIPGGGLNGLPVPCGYVRLTAGTGTAKITSPKVPVNPNKLYDLREIFTNITNQANAFVLTVYYYDAAGNPISPASTVLFTGANATLGGSANPVMWTITIPTGCYQIAIEEKENVAGSVTDIALPSLN